MATEPPSSSSSSSLSRAKIAILPQNVVHKIAAGEVVQKPVSAVKELLENAIDAGSTEVRISIEGNGYGKIVVADNGSGIPKDDLPLAAIRHATSKLRSVEDFETLDSFGFRGEALASVSMVSKLSIHSRTNHSPVGFVLSYLDGKPTSKQTRPMARKVGTTVTVDDLFYNLPHRKKRASSAREDYSNILLVAQQYAILYAGSGVGIVCEKKGQKASVDLNANSGLVQSTRQALTKDPLAGNDSAFRELQRRATKDVICQVFGSALKSQLQSFECSWKGDEATATFQCSGFVSDPSYAGSKRTTMVLFVNKRLVESRPIQRRLEEIYGEFSKSKPFLFLSITVPPNAVDVNVHPTKRQVTLLHFDEICSQLTLQCREILSELGQSFCVAEATATAKNVSATSTKRKRDNDDNEPIDLSSKTKPKNGSIQPSKFVRTSRSSQAGALEPFLQPTQPSQSQLSLSQSTTASAVSSEDSPEAEFTHVEGCPLAESSSSQNSVDLNVPGAFASIASQCACRTESTNQETESESLIRLPRQAITRPRKIVPTPCNYISVKSLRRTMQENIDTKSQDQLRKACFVGVACRNRSLIQVEEHLILLNHFEAAKELFYQLAVNRFAEGPSMAARLGAPIGIKAIIADLLESEELVQNSKPGKGCVETKLASQLPFQRYNETNLVIADQAASFLLEKADMLSEYFSIGISKVDEPQPGTIVLDTLPELLENFVPSLHGLALFLLRLATEIDWTEERPCFDGICRELASFYAQLDTDDDDLHPHVRHVIFPAVSSLLLVPHDFAGKGHFRPVTELSKLYRIFERC